MKKGFTLVELSIVLVIIGLLIGGILIGRSLIESTKINTIIKEYQQFDIATNLFKQNFGQLPGDYSSAIGILGLSRQGNGDGIIENDSGRLEPFDFFLHLSKSRIIKKDLSIYAPGATPPVVGTEAMEGKAITKSYWEAKGMTNQNLPTNAGTFPWYPVITSTTASELNKNFFIYSIHDPDSGYNTAAGIPAVIALSVDTKIDDGNAISGNVRAGLGWMGAGLSNCVTDPSSGTNYTLIYYNPTSTDGCAIVFAMSTH